MVNRFERRHVAADRPVSVSRPETQPNPDLVVAETGFVTWNVPDRRRAGFRKLRDIVRWGISIRAPEVRVLAKEIEYRIGDLESVRRLTNAQMFCALVVTTRDGKIVYEKYAPDFSPDQLHCLQSISKTTVALIMGKLVEEDRIDLSRSVSRYLPEIGSGYAEATIQQVSDMDVINDFTEDYSDPYSTVYLSEAAMGWRRAPAGQEAPTMREFLTGIRSDDIRNPSGECHYKSANTDLLGWVVERVSGRSLRDHLVDIVEAAGIEHVMFMSTDREFTPILSGGIALTARDLARYGMLFLDGGVGVGGRVVGSKAFLDAARTNRGTKRPDGFHYSNQLVSNGRWVGHGGYGGQWMLADEGEGAAVAFFSVLENASASDPDYNADRITMADDIVNFLARRR
jgi:CubicO group peptidase (beta-lactamase class C family)